MKTTDRHLEILEAAYKKAVAAVKKAPDHKAIKDLSAAEKALRDHRQSLASASDPSSTPLAKLVPEVLEYLQAQGWKIEKSKLYADAHMIKCEKNGTYTREAADKYALAVGLNRIDGSDPKLASLAEQKLRKQVELLEIQQQDDRLELEIKQKKWIRLSKVEGMLAARAALLKNGVGPEFIHARAERIIEAVHGDPARAPELVALWLDEVENLFDRYSVPIEFAAPITQGDDV